MSNRFAAVFNVVFLSLTLALLLASSQGFAQEDKPADAAAATEDIIHMTDGRVLHGKVLNETRSLVIFEYTDTTVNLTTKLTLLKDEIALIERNVAVAAQPKTTETKPAATAPATTRKAAEVERTYGTVRAAAATAAPSIYIVPMKGQMGTDINSEVYKRVVEDIRAQKPDVLVIEMDCQDTEDTVYNQKGMEESGIVDFDDYRELIRLFHNELSGTRQVCWVHDSAGISSMVALAWHELYMKPNARFGGLIVAREAYGFEGWQDEDVRGKMTAAFMAIVKGFLETGGYAFELADAMVRPKFLLSATWKGRDVIWSLGSNGEYLVDGSDERTVEFRAKTAEDFCISKGTAESLDDLALLLGYREFRLVDSQAERICADYVENWRRAYDEAHVLFQDFQQYMGWANGPDTVKYLGRAKTSLEKIITYMHRYKAVEIRLGREQGLSIQNLTVQVELIKEQLRAARQGGGAPGGGGNRGGGGLGGG